MRRAVNVATITLLALGLSWAAVPAAGNAVRTAWTLVGWNNLGMHCMNADYSVFSILPPSNTIHAQLIDPSGLLVTNPAARGVTVSYQGVADPALSINRTSAGKTNFWDWVKPLYGANVPVDMGLAGHAMPGTLNVPQPMDFDPASGWFIAAGIPITPVDDACAGKRTVGRNPRPLRRLEALLWFLVPGDDGSSTEGSWGVKSSGTERAGTAASGVCGMRVRESAVCRSGL